MRLTKFPHTEPWWGKAALARFDDPLQSYGVTYVTEHLEVAFAETILHEQANFTNGEWLVDWSSIDQRWICYYTRPDPTLKLKLLDLTGKNLKLLGLNNDVCASDQYSDSQALSRAIHEQLPEADGIYYVSRQVNTNCATALFERCDARKGAASVKLTGHPLYSQLINDFNVTIYAPIRP